MNKTIPIIALSSMMAFTSPNANSLEKMVGTSQEQVEQKTISNKDKIIEYASEYLGMEYKVWGRDTKKNPGMDCMGLCFLAYSRTFDEKWTEYSVFPSELIESKKLGERIKLSSSEITPKTISELEKGDVIYFTTPVSMFPNALEEYKDKPIIVGNEEHYVFTMGLYYGNGKVIHSAPLGKKVISENLEKYSGHFNIAITRKKNN